jgi:predicted dehydrogenase
MTDQSYMGSDRTFLVIGCGSIGKRHLANLLKLGIHKLKAFDINIARCEEIKEQFKIEVFHDLDSALSEDVDVAIICSPTSLHFEHSMLAARAGCHLFIEKPVSDSLEGLSQLSEIVTEKNLLTLIGCNFRFHPGLIKVHSLLEMDTIGKVISSRAQFGQYLPDWHPWEDYRKNYSAQKMLGGGVIFDRIHEFDYMKWLFGDVTEVVAFMDHISGLEVDTEDIAEILLKFSSGSIGSIHLDYIRRTYDASLEIIGEKGIIRWNYQNHFVEWYKTDDNKWQSIRWENHDGNRMYLEEMKHFLNILERKEDSVLPLNEAIKVLELAIATKKSAKDRIVIKL